jgi:probable F420-dependent oxidoreductase
MPTKVNVGLRVPSVHPTNPEAIRRFVRTAEDLGFHSIWAGDHVFYHMDVAQPLQLLTWIAGQTSRVRLGTSVMLSSYLNPVLLAKAAATIDCLSGGRLTLGMSIGGTEAEYRSIGVPMEQRLGRFLENVRIMRLLWRAGDEDVTYEGRYHSLQAANIRPKPAQPGGVPIYFGANSEAMRRRAARLADGWCCSSGPTIDGFLSQASQILEVVGEAGRDTSRFGFVKQHNVSIDKDPDLARKRAEDHFHGYYGPRYNIASTTHGTFDAVAEQLAGFGASDLPEITLALEPATLDTDHLAQVWEATKSLR